MKKKRNRKTCHKIGYHTKSEARQAFKDFGKASGARRFYKCPHHNGEEVWHLTSEER
jgi:hypothetical protein